MRITQSTVERLAAEAGRVTGRPMIESINRPGDGRTHYVMAESATSTYCGARNAAAYLLGVLAGADPAGAWHWAENMPAWIQVIDAEFKFGQIAAASLAAYNAGNARARTLRQKGSS